MDPMGHVIINYFDYLTIILSFFHDVTIIKCIINIIPSAVHPVVSLHHDFTITIKKVQDGIISPLKKILPWSSSPYHFTIFHHVSAWFHHSNMWVLFHPSAQKITTITRVTRDFQCSMINHVTIGIFSWCSAKVYHISPCFIFMSQLTIDYIYIYK